MNKIVQHIIRAAISFSLITFVAACGTEDGEARREIQSTTARPIPVPEKRKSYKTKWTEPTEAVERKALNLKSGGTAHLAVTADTFDGASMVAGFRDEMVVALEELQTFNQVNISGNQGHYAIGIVIVDYREEDGFLFFSGGLRFKIALTVIDTKTKRRLLPDDPDNLFYGDVSEVIAEIAEYLAK